jgi:hypothetical protein
MEPSFNLHVLKITELEKEHASALEELDVMANLKC